jgi:hypothetical protein
MNFTFNIALGKVASYAANVMNNTPAASALIVVPLETTGLESDANMRQHATLAALLAASSNEQTTAGRKTVNAGITLTIDAGTSTVIVKAPDVTWPSVGASNQVAAFVWCYVPDEAVVNDALAIPLTKHDRLWTPDGTPFILSGPSGFFQAAAA